MYLHFKTSEHSKQSLRNLLFRGTVLLKDSIFPWATKSPLRKVCFLSKYKISYFKGQLNYTGYWSIFCTLPHPGKNNHNWQLNVKGITVKTMWFTLPFYNLTNHWRLTHSWRNIILKLFTWKTKFGWVCVLFPYLKNACLQFQRFPNKFFF